MRRAPHCAFQALQARDGDHVRVPIGPRTVDLLSDPETSRTMILALGLMQRTLKLEDATGTEVQDHALVGLVPAPAPMLRVADAG